MTPPRGDNWAGCLGHDLGHVGVSVAEGSHAVVCGLVTAFFAIRFSTAELIKLLGISTESWPINCDGTDLRPDLRNRRGGGHDLPLKRLPVVPDDPRPVLDGNLSLGFVLLVIPFLNIRKNLESIWLPNHVIPVDMYGHSAAWWFNMAYLAVALTVIF